MKIKFDIINNETALIICNIAKRAVELMLKRSKKLKIHALTPKDTEQIIILANFLFSLEMTS
ncbi:MAG: hypothetical protein LBS83_03610 [Holosporales bacterium]|nr:hypothetical protein [Holosporales bacterium]